MYKIVIIRVIIKLMARLTIKEIINRGYITSVELAVGLMDGTYTLEDDIIKEGLTQVGVYDEVYSPEPEVVEEVVEETVTEEVTEEPVKETVTEPELEVTEETEETVTEPELEVTEETEETVTESVKDINKCSEILDKAVELDIVHKSGSWYSYNGAKLGQGKTVVINTLSGNPELLGEIEAKVIGQTNNDIYESKGTLNE